jgi:hypothetical protein
MILVEGDTANDTDFAMFYTLQTTGRSPSSTILSAAVASANIKQRNVNVSYNSEKELLVWSSPTSYNNNITNLSENPVTISDIQGGDHTGFNISLSQSYYFVPFLLFLILYALLQFTTVVSLNFS